MSEREYDDDRPHPDDGKTLPSFTVGAVLEHKAKKLCPGAGPWVVLLRYGDTWVLYRGANSEKKANERRRELPQWRDEDIRVVENVAVTT